MNSYVLEDYAMESEHRVMTHLATERLRITSQLGFVKHKMQCLSDTYASGYANEFWQKELSHFEGEKQGLAEQLEFVEQQIGKHAHYFTLDEQGLVDVGLGCC
jgi:hypothetical protein